MSSLTCMHRTPSSALAAPDLWQTAALPRSEARVHRSFLHALKPYTAGLKTQ